jgi:hypothetical protein
MEASFLKSAPVKIGLRDRLELMVVAAGAAEGHPQECQTHRVGHIVERVLPALSLTGGVGHVGPEKIETRGDQGGHIAREHFVSRQLFLNEAVVWLVRVERSDDVIAVAPGIGAGFVEFVAVALGEPSQVEPMPAPALAVLRTGQKSVDRLLQRLLARVHLRGVAGGHEVRGFLRCGREPDQVER